MRGLPALKYSLNFMINIKNTQRKIALDVESLRQDAKQVLEILKYPDFDLGIWISNNRTIREYNKNFRDKNKPTDILSFPYHTELNPGDKIKVVYPEDKNLGDLIISAEYVQEEAERYNVSLEERLRLLLVHGICHLLGYDHIIDKDYRQMRAKEAFLMKKLNQQL